MSEDFEVFDSSKVNETPGVSKRGRSVRNTLKNRIAKQEDLEKEENLEVSSSDSDIAECSNINTLQSMLAVSAEAGDLNRMKAINNRIKEVHFEKTGKVLLSREEEALQGLKITDFYITPPPTFDYRNAKKDKYNPERWVVYNEEGKDLYFTAHPAWTPEIQRKAMEELGK